MHAERAAFDVFVSITTAIGHAPVEINQGNARKRNNVFNVLYQAQKPPLHDAQVTAKHPSKSNIAAPHPVR
jgi:hypothetical protein